MKNLQREEIIFLAQYLHFSYSDFSKMPVIERKSYFNLIKNAKEEKEQEESSNPEKGS